MRPEPCGSGLTVRRWGIPRELPLEVVAHVAGATVVDAEQLRGTSGTGAVRSRHLCRLRSTHCGVRPVGHVALQTVGAVLFTGLTTVPEREGSVPGRHAPGTRAGHVARVAGCAPLGDVRDDGCRSRLGKVPEYVPE